MKTFIMTLMILLAFTSCSKNIAKKKKTKARMTLALGTDKYPAGVIIYGEKKDSDIFFAKTVDGGDTLEIDLDNGEWGFAAIGWKGSNGNAMEGKARCASTSNINLTGEDEDILFELDVDGCGRSTFGNETAKDLTDNGYGFEKLKITSCAGLSNMMYDEDGHSDDGSSDDNSSGDYHNLPNCDEHPGRGKSFKVKLFQFEPTSNPVANKTAGLTSRCIKNLSSGASVESDLRIPIFNGSIPILTEIIAFDDENCSSSHNETIFFHEGSMEPAQGNKGFYDSDEERNNNHVFLNSKLCRDDFEGDDPNPYGESNFVICTPEQFAKIGEAEYLGKEIYLMKDLNFAGKAALMDGGSIVTVTNGWHGVFDGNGHKLYNITLESDDEKMGIFNYVKSHTLIDTEIRNLVLENVQVKNTKDTTGAFVYTGGLAGFVQPPGSAKDIIITNIDLNDVRVLKTDGGTPKSYTGGLIGQVNNPNGVQISIYNVSSNNLKVSSDSLEPVYVSVGGLVGQLSTNDNADSSIEIKHIDFGDSDSSIIEIDGLIHVGGLIGKVSASPGNIEIRDGNQFNGSIKAHYSSGGIVGSLTNAKVEYSYANVEFIKSNLPLFEGGTPLDSHNIGGIVGHAYSNNTGEGSFIKGNFAEIFGESDGIHNNVGGIVGSAVAATSTAFVEISNNKSNIGHDNSNNEFIPLKLNGSEYGGIVGKADASVISASISITGNVSYGKISERILLDGDGNEIPNTSNYNRGGLVGDNVEAELVKNISKTDVVGYTNIAGGVAKNSGIINELVVEGDVIINNEVASFVAGGIVAVNSGIITETFYEGFLESNEGADPDCTTSNICGVIVGNNLSGATVSDSIGLGVVTYDDDSDSDSEDEVVTSPPLCGSGSGICNFRVYGQADFNDDEDSDSEEEYGEVCDELLDDAGSAPYDYTAKFSLIDESCIPKFYHDWMELGESDSNGGSYLLAGNMLEPFIISNEADWNRIEDNELLLAKTFKIINREGHGERDEYNFSSGGFKPIGGMYDETKPFRGKIIAEEGVVLTGISIEGSDGFSQMGVITHAIGAEIGEEWSPLVVEGITINVNNSDANYVGAIGLAENTKISMEVSGAEYSGTSDGVGCNEGADFFPCYVGGIVGKLHGNGEIKRSRWFGTIDLGNFEAVGGLAGKVLATNGEIYIQENIVETELLRGRNYVGGLAGSISGADSTRIKHNVAWLNSAELTVIAGDLGGISPDVEFNTILMNNYVDLTSAVKTASNIFGFTDTKTDSGPPSSSTIFSTNYIIDGTVGISYPGLPSGIDFSNDYGAFEGNSDWFGGPHSEWFFNEQGRLEYGGHHHHK